MIQRFAQDAWSVWKGRRRDRLFHKLVSSCLFDWTPYKSIVYVYRFHKFITVSFMWLDNNQVFETAHNLMSIWSLVATELWAPKAMRETNRVGELNSYILMLHHPNRFHLLSASITLSFDWLQGSMICRSWPSVDRALWRDVEDCFDRSPSDYAGYYLSRSSFNVTMWMWDRFPPRSFLIHTYGCSSRLLTLRRSVQNVHVQKTKLHDCYFSIH